MISRASAVNDESAGPLGVAVATSPRLQPAASVAAKIEASEAARSMDFMGQSYPHQRKTATRKQVAVFVRTNALRPVGAALLRAVADLEIEALRRRRVIALVGRRRVVDLLRRARILAAVQLALVELRLHRGVVE